jgi:hypothetical protein
MKEEDISKKFKWRTSLIQSYEKTCDVSIALISNQRRILATSMLSEKGYFIEVVTSDDYTKGVEF